MILKPSALERIVQSFERELSPDFARKLLALHFSPADHARAQELSQKAQLGALRADEEAELDDLLTANDVLIILQSKARIALNQKPSAA
jgi:hypothetical protein